MKPLLACECLSIVNMEAVQIPSEDVKSTVKTEKKSPSTKRAEKDYCLVCRTHYWKDEAQDHMHGMLHHRELEALLGRVSFHECQACKASAMGLNEYAQHISTAQHKDKLKTLIHKNIKPLSLHKTLSSDTMAMLLERNKMLKNQEKKATKKKRKKRKQIAGQKNVELNRKSKGMSKVVKRGNSKHLIVEIPQHLQQAHTIGSNNAVYQNKENKMSVMQRPLKSESIRIDQFSQLGYHIGNFGNTGYNTLERKNKGGSIETNALFNKPYGAQGAGANMNGQSTSHYNNYWPIDSSTGVDFTMDYSPQTEGFTFGNGGERCPQTSHPEQKQAAPFDNTDKDRPVIASTVREVDVSVMIRQVRRALGVREPCRADREARRKNAEKQVNLTNQSAAQQTGSVTVQPAGASLRSSTWETTPHTSASASTSLQPPQVNITGPAPYSGIHPTSNISPLKMTQGSTQQSNGWESGLQAGIVFPSTSSDLNPSHTRKVRIAHKPRRMAQRDKETGLNQSLQKLLSMSGIRSKPDWRTIYEGSKRSKKRNEGTPRFGAELTSSSSNPEMFLQAEDNALPLSQGFHWESIPDCHPVPHLSPPPQESVNNDSHTETEQSSRMQEPLEEPPLAQEGRRSRSGPTVAVKVEQNMEQRENEETSSARKRSCNVIRADEVSDEEPNVKKKKIKSNKDQDQLDQLYDVSLREEQLNHRLQDVDKSVIQAQNALQTLMLLREKYITDINNLRAKRIQILQEMQEGYSGVSPAEEKATTSSFGAISTSLPSCSAYPSFSPQPLPHQVSSISQPHPVPAASVKQEMHHKALDEQASQVPQNQLEPMFPSAPTPAAPVPPAKQLPAECTAPTNVPPSVESSVKKVIESDETETEDKNDPKTAAEKSVSKDKNGSTAASDKDAGNESDDSVELMEPPKQEVINIDESDNEDSAETPQNVPVQQELPQNSVSVDFSSAGTQTSPQKEDEKKFPVPDVSAKDGNVPSGSGDVEDEEPSVGEFSSHTGPAYGLQVYEGLLYTCSGDNTARAYNLVTRECQSVFDGHTNKINCLLVASYQNNLPRLYTGSSDQTIRCFSIRSKKCLEQISLPDRVLCLHIGWNILYAGLANGSVTSFDLKTLKELDVFECHGPRGVSCLATAQEGARRVLLVGSYDSTISVRDARSGLLLRSLQGHSKTVLCMKVVNDLVFSGSSDTSIHAHNIHTGQLVRIYKGHGHAVTSIAILGKVMVTACLDKLVRVYELQSHDCLQVYGGYTDMVMCMTIHKSLIYTGCYDGSVQAVKLNLMKNFRCWWQNCSLIYGLAEHLVQHLLHDHTNPNQQTVKCRWKDCSAFFGTQQSVCQELPEHVQSHVDCDSNVQPRHDQQHSFNTNAHLCV